MTTHKATYTEDTTVDTQISLGKQSQPSSARVRRLTPSELESLRQDMKEASDYCDKELRKRRETK